MRIRTLVLIPVIVALAAAGCGSDGGDQEVQTTAPSPPPLPVDAPDLVGVAFAVTSIERGGESIPPPAAVNATVEFADDGTFSGFAGCNQFSGEYTVDGTDLTIGEFVMEGQACEIGDWTELLDALPAVESYGSAGGPSPILFAANDTSIVLGADSAVPTGPEPIGADVDPAVYIGLTEAEAVAQAEQASTPLRVGRRDDEFFALTMDYDPGRVTIEIDDGVVTSATAG